MKFPTRGLGALAALMVLCLASCTPSPTNGSVADTPPVSTDVTTAVSPTVTSSPSALPTPTGPPLSSVLAGAPHFLLFLGGALGDLSVTRIEGHDIDVPTSTAVVAGAPMSPTDSVLAPVLAPDRRKVAYVEGPAATLQATGEGAIVVQNIDGTGAKVLVPSGAGSPSWSPDSARIAYLKGDHELWVMASDGSGQKAVGVALAVNPHMAWAPDGARLLVGAGNPSRLAVIDLAAARFDYIGLQGVQQDNPGWSPDGKQIVYSQSGANALFVANPDGTGARQITTCLNPACSRDLEPAWSPDGITIAFSRYAPGAAAVGAQQIWVVPAVGGQARQVTAGREEHSTPTW